MLYLSSKLLKDLEAEQIKGKIFGELINYPEKLIEIVGKILERYNPKKVLSPDFQIYSNKEVGERADPDITSVIENEKNRAPNLFIEIKRLDPDARWLGPRGHQLKEIHKGFMIHASLEFLDEKSKKERDITASILKLLLKSNSINLDAFSDFHNLQATINFIYPFSYIMENGHFLGREILFLTTIFLKHKLHSTRIDPLGRVLKL